MDALKCYHLKNSDLTARKKFAVNYILLNRIQMYVFTIFSREFLDKSFTEISRFLSSRLLCNEQFYMSAR